MSARPSPATRGTLVATLVALFVLGAAQRGHADWASDEAYIKHMRQQLVQLKAAVELFERQRRSLELVEAEFAALQLPLADSSIRPEKLVRQILATSFPDVHITMGKIATHAPLGVEIWKWRCTVRGVVEEIRWATQLLLQKGLFVLPSPQEPVELRLDPDQRHGTLSFTGHHIRLKDIPPRTLPKLLSGPDALARRTDPLADEIRQLRVEVMPLRARAAEIMSFEARVEAMRNVIRHLKSLTRGAHDPFRVFTPLLDLELVRYSSLQHSGEELRIRGAVPSVSAREAASRWLGRQRRRKLRHRVEPLELLYTAPSTRAIEHVDAGAVGPGPRCSLLACGARAVDIGAAAGAHAVVAVGSTGRVSGQIDAPGEQALESAARALGLTLVRHGDHALLLPRARAPEASRRLREPAPIAGPDRELTLQQSGKLPEVLAVLQDRGKRPIEVVAGALKTGELLTLSGRARLADWLRLIGAAFGLRFDGSSDRLRLVAREADAAKLVTPGAATHTSGDVGAAPLAALRPRVWLRCGARRVTVVGEPSGPPIVVLPGTLLGRGRARVARIDAAGVTVSWTDGRQRGAILLPFGERAKPISAGPATPPATSGKRP